MLRDPLFIKSLGVTNVYLLCLVPGLYVSGLGLALVVRQRIPLVRWWDFGGLYFHAVRFRCIDLEGDAR